MDDRMSHLADSEKGRTRTSGGLGTPASSSSLHGSPGARVILRLGCGDVRSLHERKRRGLRKSHRRTVRQRYVRLCQRVIGHGRGVASPAPCLRKATADLVTKHVIANGWESNGVPGSAFRPISPTSAPHCSSRRSGAMGPTISKRSHSDEPEPGKLGSRQATRRVVVLLERLRRRLGVVYSSALP